MKFCSNNKFILYTTVFFALSAATMFIALPAKAENYHTIAVMDNTTGLSESDSALTSALNTLTSYRLEALPETSLVPEADLEALVQPSDVGQLWSLDREIAKKVARASNADLLVIGRHTAPQKGTVSCEFHVIYLALDETVRASRIKVKLSANNMQSMQKKLFDKLVSKLPVAVPVSFWKKQRVIRGGKAFDWFAEGLRHVASKRDAAGFASFEKALGADPGSRDIHYFIGRYYATRQFNYERAVFHFGAILKNNTADAYANYWLGFTYYLKADYQSAIKEFERSKAGGPVEAALMLGALYEQNGNYESAAANYRAALKVVPQRASIWYSLAAALTVLGRTDDAVAALKRTFELDLKGFYDMARSDADLAQLRRVPEYKKLIEEFK